jgi:hypothetical protein
MITFSIMTRTRFLMPLLMAAFALPCVSKTPEEFVAQSPAVDTSKAATKPSAKPVAAKPAAKIAPKAVAKPAIDTARIHAGYLDGDFDQAIRTLETALKGRKPLSHADSVFAFKHLGVMYAATPATREKGRFYMLQLISIEPTARILDMYASDMIYLIFRNVQEEYENKHAKVAAAAPLVDTTPPAADLSDSTPASVPAAAPVKPARNRTLYWVAGGAAITAGAAGLLFILLDNPQPKKRNIVLTE